LTVEQAVGLMAKTQSGMDNTMSMSMTMSDLSELALFAGCQAADIERVVGREPVIRRLMEGQVLCREGDPASAWWIVLDGLADATVGGRYIATIGEGETKRGGSPAGRHGV
jgi:hypothetical protein